MKFVWTKRRFEGGAYAPVQDQFETHFMDLGGPREMLMIADTADPLVQIVYLRLPETLLGSYPGFDHVAESALPQEAMLVGHQKEFEARFAFPSTRRRPGL